MNDQPYGVPFKHWPPKMTPWWFHATTRSRHRALAKQKMTDVTLVGTDYLARSLDSGHGVMITPNHSFHWDSYCLLRAAEKLKCPFYFMSAWQVFATSKWFERESMQRCGCFSVDREGNDVQSLKTAVDILQSKSHPLVVFPEGDIYHTNDRITPFRDGAAAMALMAARKAERPVCILPVAIKRWYIDDPTKSLLKTVERIEARMLWKSRPDLELVPRVLKLAEGLIGTKEIEYLGAAQSGNLPERIQGLMNWLLQECESKYGIAPKSQLAPERIKEVRRSIIALQDANATSSTAEQRQAWGQDMHKMFLATQLFSYPGDYLQGEPTIERVAETIDKLEEDTLQVAYPTVHGARRVVVQFGAPIVLPSGKDKKTAPSSITDQIEATVQTMLDKLTHV